MFKLYQHQEIDLEKWDECILKAQNGNLFCMSWYLNIIHPNWKALILEGNNKYLAVIPLLESHRWGLTFHKQPPLAQLLGPVYFKELKVASGNEICKQFKKRYVLYKYPSKEKFLSVCHSLVEHYNYVLPLDKPYKKICSGYRRDRKYRIKQAKANELNIKEADSPSKLLTLFRQEVVPKIAGGVSQTSLNHINDIAQYVIDHKNGFLLEASNQKNQTLSAALFIIFRERIIYINSATNNEGRQKNANTLILDWVIEKFAYRNYTLDFEGSDVPGIADFFKSFGAMAETYYEFKYENWWIKLLINIKRLFSNYK